MNIREVITRSDLTITTAHTAETTVKRTKPRRRIALQRGLFLYMPEQPKSPISSGFWAFGGDKGI